METNFHVVLEQYEIEAINFVKKKQLDEDLKNLEPKYKVLVSKNDNAKKEGILILTLQNEYFNLKLIVKGLFRNERGNNIENDLLSSLILPLLLPFTRSVVHNYLRDAGFYNQMLPTIDVPRSIDSMKIKEDQDD